MLLLAATRVIPVERGRRVALNQGRRLRGFLGYLLGLGGLSAHLSRIG